jgi:hypothetical protein
MRCGSELLGLNALAVYYRESKLYKPRSADSLTCLRQAIKVVAVADIGCILSRYFPALA